jgi:ribonuclease P protein component
MKKQFRVRNAQEFQSIISSKKFSANQSFVIYYKNKKEEQARVGISVGKKLGKATDRNVIKRQVRMMFQELLENPLDKDMICIIRAGYKMHSYKENKKLLENLVFKVNIVVDER